jgi:DNA-directed RNA polymerase sigma subunit (sigma70/sigma32)
MQLIRRFGADAYARALELCQQVGHAQELDPVLAQLAEEMGVSKERIRQLQREGEHLLRAA